MDTPRAGQARERQLQGGTKGGSEKEGRVAQSCCSLSLSFLPFFLRPRASERQLCRGKGEQPLQAQNHRAGEERGRVAWEAAAGGRWQAGEYVGLSAAAVLEVIFEIQSLFSRVGRKSLVGMLC